MRRDFNIIPNGRASYEICFDQALKTDTNTSVVYSAGFQLLQGGVNDGKTYFFEDDTKGNVYLFTIGEDNSKIISDPSFGTVDYQTGDVRIGYDTPVVFANTALPNSIIQIRAFPFGQDVIAKQSVYLELDLNSSQIDSFIDTNILSQ